MSMKETVRDIVQAKTPTVDLRLRFHLLGAAPIEVTVRFEAEHRGEVRRLVPALVADGVWRDARVYYPPHSITHVELLEGPYPTFPDVLPFPGEDK